MQGRVDFGTDAVKTMDGRRGAGKHLCFGLLVEATQLLLQKLDPLLELGNLSAMLHVVVPRLDPQGSYFAVPLA